MTYSEGLDIADQYGVIDSFRNYYWRITDLYQCTISEDNTVRTALRYCRISNVN